ncbi:MAG: transposase, partial [Actinomycetia bacterium]|nr:transposase [Actinomycetes bacterium]
PKDLSVRVHKCPACGLVMDRDEVSARLVQAAEPVSISRTGTVRSHACGDSGDLTERLVGVTVSLKQEKFPSSK